MTDFTHDTCAQRYKTGSLGVIGFHFVKGEWHATCIPMNFCIARGETINAYAKMFESIIRAFSEKFGIDLVDLVSEISFYGSPACGEAIARFFSNKINIRLLAWLAGLAG